MKTADIQILVDAPIDPVVPAQIQKLYEAALSHLPIATMGNRGLMKITTADIATFKTYRFVFANQLGQDWRLIMIERLGTAKNKPQGFAKP